MSRRIKVYLKPLMVTVSESKLGMGRGYWAIFFVSIISQFFKVNEINTTATCQTLMWSKEFNRNFCKTDNFSSGEINYRSFSTRHTWSPNTRTICSVMTRYWWRIRITTNVITNPYPYPNETILVRRGPADPCNSIEIHSKWKCFHFTTLRS